MPSQNHQRFRSAHAPAKAPKTPIAARYARSRNTAHRTNRNRHENPARPATRKKGPTELFVRYASPAATPATRIHRGRSRLFRIAATVTTNRRVIRFSAYPVPVVVTRTGSSARRPENQSAFSRPNRLDVATKNTPIRARPATNAATWTAASENPIAAMNGTKYTGYAGG